MQGDRMAVVVNLLAVPIGQPGESSHVHSHREILALNIAGTHMLWVRVTTHNLKIAADALCRGVAACFFVGWSAVNLLQHRVINIRTECVLDGL